MQKNQTPAVLIVEDDSLLRAIAVEIVEDAGYVALESSNADEAVVILEARTDITVLFTDINMPGSMDGLKLAHAVRNRWPPVKIIMVSGDVRLTPAELPSDTQFFQKPYKASEMVSQLRALLSSPLTAGLFMNPN